MRVAVDRLALAGAVSFASRATPRTSPIPALLGLRLDIKSDALRVSAFDFDLYAEEVIAASADGATSVLVPGRVVAQYLGGMSHPIVTLDVDERSVVMTCGDARVTLQRLPLEEYPSAPPAPPEVVSVSAEALAEGLATAREAIDPNSAVQALRAIDLSFTREQLSVAGIHDQRVAVRRLACKPSTEARVLAPASIADAAPVFVGDVTVGLDDARLALSDGPRKVITRLIADQASRYPELLARHVGETRLTLDRAELTDAVRWVVLGDSRKVARGHLIWDVLTDSVQITMNDGGVVNAESTVAAKLDGEPLKMGWRAENLLRGLAATHGETVTLHIGNVKRAVLMTADDDDAFTYLAQPVVLSA